MRRLKLKISGCVQGVFFRHSARLHAEEQGISGWARNEADGSLAIVAEGGEEALEKFLAWCRNGPPLARVNEVKVEWQEAMGQFKRFEIL